MLLSASVVRLSIFLVSYLASYTVKQPTSECHSFIFMPAFPIRRVVGAAARRGLGIPHGQQQSQIILLTPHQDGTKQGRRLVTPPGPWTTSGPPFRGFSQQDLPLQSFVGHSRRMAEPMQLGSRFEEKWFNICGFCEFHSCALCRKVSHRWLFIKIPSLSLVLGTVCFQSLPKVHEHRCRSEQKTI